MLDTMQDLSGELELPKVLERVLQRAVALLGVTGGELATYDETRRDLAIVASHNLETNAVGVRMALGEGAMGKVAENHEPLIIPRYQEWAGHSGKYELTSIQSVMAAPLMIGSRLVGAIASVHSDPTRAFGEADLRRLMMFAPQAAVAIENARLFSAAQQYFEVLVRNNPVAIVNLDFENRITSCNPAFETLFGHREADVLGKDLDHLVTTEATLVRCPRLHRPGGEGEADLLRDRAAVPQGRDHSGRGDRLDPGDGRRRAGRDDGALPRHHRAAQGAPRGGGGQRDQEPLPGQHQSRTPHAAERHHRLQRDAPGTGRGRRPSGADPRPRQDPLRREAPPGRDQRHPRPFQDRGGEDGALPRDLRAGAGRHRRGHDGPPPGREAWQPF